MSIIQPEMEMAEILPEGFYLADLQAYAFFTAFWCILYASSMRLPIPMKDLYRKLPLDDELDLRNRQISFVHGLSVLVLTTYAMLFRTGQCMSPNTFFDSAVMYSSMGYFTYDFLAMVYYGLLAWPMTIHHAMSIAILGLNISSRNSAFLILGGMFIGEISNPSMHLSAMLKHLGLRYSKVYELCEISFAFLYILGRVFMGSVQLYRIITCENSHLILKFSTSALALQSYFFVYNMIPLMQDRVGVIFDRRRLGIKACWMVPVHPADLEKLGIDPNKIEKFVL
jgi:hypothetical protein